MTLSTHADGLDELFAYVGAQMDRSIERLGEYLSRPSISVTGEGIAETAAHLAGWLTELGFDAVVHETPGHPVVVARRDGPPGRPTVLLYGHYDVQPPEPLDAWTTPPFEPTIRNGRIYARGAGDNKGQHFAQLLAIETHLAVHGELPCGVVMVLDGEEEVGSPNLDAFVADHRDELDDVDLVVTADGPMADGDRARLILGCRGVLAFEIRIRGARRDLHSGNFGGAAPQPAWELVQLLATMRAADGRITIDGGVGGRSPLVDDADLAAIDAGGTTEAALRDVLGVERLEGPHDRSVAQRLACWPTLTINGVHSGWTGPGSKTVLPDEAWAICDIRLVPGQVGSDVFEHVRRHVADRCPHAEVTNLTAMEPSRTPVDSPWTPLVRGALAAAHGYEPDLVPIVGGSLPEHTWTGTLGKHAFITPYANADEANHAPDENLDLGCFAAGIRTGVALLAALGQHAAASAAD
ncbi:MAG: M20/M25/M40 family metallo-hydrolase [Actinomycetota bacterium]|nr:M20/M25/M40 family metallo-hydrolase [Actinomycetota bacterium]